MSPELEQGQRAFTSAPQLDTNMLISCLEPPCSKDAQL